MRGSVSDLRTEVAGLGSLSREDLAARWAKSFGSAPPVGVRRDLLERAVAWHLQAGRCGGFSAETRRLLKAAMASAEARAAGRAVDRYGDERIVVADRAATGDEQQGDEADNSGSIPGPLASDAAPASSSKGRQQRQRRTVRPPGARLLREWNGQTHVIDAIKGGYVFEAKVYPSLTAIAGKITGAHWSGPRFFGL